MIILKIITNRLSITATPHFEPLPKAQQNLRAQTYLCCKKNEVYSKSSCEENTDHIIPTAVS